MTILPYDVNQDLNKLIVASAGFQENDENFRTCKKFCLSHFLHHSYPSVNKATVQTALEGFQSRFFMHGSFQVADALKKEVDTFLSHQNVFRAIPECEIEWNVLSLVTSLASNLSSVRDLPPLLHPSEEAEPEDEFDWSSYLKQGLPRLVSFNGDSDSDSYSLSSLTSVSGTECDEGDSESDFEIPLTEPPTQVETETAKLWCGALAKAKEERRRKLRSGNDVGNGALAQLWHRLKVKRGIQTSEPEVISEKEVTEIVLRSLLSGQPFNLHYNSLSYLTQEAFGRCLKYLEPYVQCMCHFRKFFSSLVESENVPIVVKAYASSLRRCLTPYEHDVSNMDQESESLLRLSNRLKPLLAYIQSLASTHRQCVTQLGDEPPWRTSLRILLVLYSNTIESTSEEYLGTYFALFVSCFSAFAESLDCILTSSYPTKSLQEQIIYRVEDSAEPTPSQIFKAHPFQSLLHELGLGNIPFLDPIVEKIEEATTSLSIVYLLNRFTDLSDELENVPTLSQTILQAAHSAIGGRQHLGGYDISEDVMKSLFVSEADLVENQTEIVDLFDVCSYSETLDCMIPIHRNVEKAFHDAVSLRIDCVSRLAKKILFKEHKLDKHLNLLQNVMLFHNASQLIPFTQVLFASKENLRIDSEEERGHSEVFLSVLLRMCVEGDFPDIVSHLSVEVNDFCEHDIFRDIDCISISYNVSYPLSLILTGPVLKKYNEIFRALLKIKWVHSMLCRLPFLDIDEMPEAQSVIQRLHVLRFSCLSDLGHIISYFTAQVASPLYSDMGGLQDVQDIIHEHESRLERIHTRCMLGEGDQHYTIIFRRVLPLCLELQTYWSLKNRNLMSGLKKLEELHSTNRVLLQLLMCHLEHDAYVPLGDNRVAMNALATTLGSC